MKTKTQIQRRIAELEDVVETLKAKKSLGFSYPNEYAENNKQTQVRQVLIVGLKWVLK